MAGRSDAPRCFVCGPQNPIGLGVRFRMEGEVCRGEFTPGTDHVGFDGVVHGGILYCVLDDVMANWFFLQGVRGYTARCQVRYRQPVSVGEPLQLEGRLLRRRGRMAVMEGLLRRAGDGTVAALSEATFMLEGGEG